MVIEALCQVNRTVNNLVPGRRETLRTRLPFHSILANRVRGGYFVRRTLSHAMCEDVFKTLVCFLSVDRGDGGGVGGGLLLS